VRRGLVALGAVGAGALLVATAQAASRAPAAAGEPMPKPPGAVAQPPAPLRALALPDLDVTLGALAASEGRLLVESPKFRAVALRRTPPVVELDFTYLGPTAAEAALASGELRRQLGLKLRAADGCNLVYVMWRIDPRPGLVVSIKRNPGARTHRECGARGYRNVRPQRAGALPRLVPGGRHTLRAEMEDDRLAVRVDGATVWEGRLGAEVLAFDGPVGMRTDNARVAFQIRAPAP